MARQSPSDPVAVEPATSRLEDSQPLERVTFRATDDQLAALESLVDAGVYHSRSEALRAGIQRLLEDHAESEREGTRERD